MMTMGVGVVKGSGDEGVTGVVRASGVGEGVGCAWGVERA